MDEYGTEVPRNEIRVPVWISPPREGFEELWNSLPELTQQLQERFPQVQTVAIRIENPTFMVHGLVPAWILISVGGGSIGKKFLEDLGDDLYKWAKRKGLKLKPRKKTPRKRK